MLRNLDIRYNFDWWAKSWCKVLFKDHREILPPNAGVLQDRPWSTNCFLKHIKSKKITSCCSSSSSSSSIYIVLSIDMPWGDVLIQRPLSRNIIFKAAFNKSRQDVTYRLSLPLSQVTYFSVYRSDVTDIYLSWGAQYGLYIKLWLSVVACSSPIVCLCFRLLRCCTLR